MSNKSQIFATKPDVIPTFKKYYQNFQSKGKNKFQLKFDPNLNIELKEINGYLCMGSLTPLEDSKSQNTVKCPLDGTIYHKSFAKTTCQTCLLTTLGVDALGLNNLIEEKQE